MRMCAARLVLQNKENPQLISRSLTVCASKEQQNSARLSFERSNRVLGEGFEHAGEKGERAHEN